MTSTEDLAHRSLTEVLQRLADPGAAPRGDQVAAVDALRETVTDAKIGLVTNYQPIYPSSDRPEDKAEAALKFIKAQKHKAWIIGEVVKGKGEARVE